MVGKSVKLCGALIQAPRFLGLRPIICVSGLALLFFACASTGSGEPDWVRDPYVKYNRQANIAAVGSGSSRDIAEKNALRNLLAIFGQSIQVDEKVSMSYQEAVKNGVTASWLENIIVDTGITTSIGMDSLTGAETGDVWNDGKGSYYATAVLNKANAIQVYSLMVSSNQAIINKLVDIPASEKNTLEGFARFQFAATLADVTASYVNLLAVIGGPVQALKKGDDFRLEAVNVSRAIPVALRVKNDRAGRIQGAFARVLSELGFASGGGNTRYILDVNVTTSPVALPANQNLFTRIELVANFIDAESETVLIPFYISSREGHITQDEADNRAYAVVERKIGEEYIATFNNYISRLLPGIKN